MLDEIREARGVVRGQGEVTDKPELQRRFSSKLQRTSEDPTLVDRLKAFRMQSMIKTHR